MTARFPPVRRGASSARRAVLTGLALCLGGHLALGFGLDGYWSALRDPEYGCRLNALRERQREEPGRPLVLALGTSRTQMGFKPDAMTVGPLSPGPGRPAAEPLVFNLGLAGCAPLTSLVVLHRLKADGVRPDWVLLEVLPPALHLASMADDLLGGDRVALLKWDDLETARPYCRDPGGLRADWLRARLAPLSAVRFSVVSRFIPGWLPAAHCRRYLWENNDGFGWLCFPLPAPSPEYRARQWEHAQVQYAANLAGFSIMPEPDRALRDALAFCRAEGWRVAVYLMPEGERFRAMYPPGARELLDRYLAGVGRDFGVPVLDARGFIPDESEFSDSHHPLPSGAQHFSERFAREALGPWLRGEPIPAALRAP
jgi:hypothetical protein